MASRYSRREEMKRVATVLRSGGCDVVCRWLETEWVNRPDDSSAAPPEYREKYAVIDAEDVSGADVVVSFTELPNAGGRGGRHVEFGMAVALGKRCVVVGYRENLFHHLPGVEFYETTERMIESLTTKAGV